MDFLPKLPVLEHLIKDVEICKEGNWHIVSVQHLMRSTGSMFRYLIDIGFIPEDIWVLSKVYSFNKITAMELQKLGVNVEYPTDRFALGEYANSLKKDVVRMWGKVQQCLKDGDRIIVLDDGGFCISSIPGVVLQNYEVYGIEQTSSGIRMKHNFDLVPVINVAESAAKRLIEPAIVSEAVQIKLGEKIRQMHPNKIGLVGFGVIGQAVYRDLVNDYRVVVFDVLLNDSIDAKVDVVDSVSLIYNNCDLIIGATGNDISSPDWYFNAKGDKSLLSISSGDIEFNGLLKVIHKFHTEKIQSPLDDIDVFTPSGFSIKIARGGLVANFTGEPDSSPSEIIQFTRGLLISAIIMILNNHKRMIEPGNLMLDPSLQQYVFRKWIEFNPDRCGDYSPAVQSVFKSIKTIVDHSGGREL